MEIGRSMKEGFPMSRRRIVLCFSVVVVASMAYGGENKTTELFSMALLSKGTEYVRNRNELKEIVRKDPTVLNATTNATNDWQTVLLVDILKESVAKEGEIAALLKWQRPDDYIRAWESRVQTHGKLIAAEAKEVPMFLVEKIWKGNELTFGLGDENEQLMWTMSALARLQVKAASRPLEMFLNEDEYDFRVVETALTALGEIADPRSLPAVLKIVLEPPKPGMRITHAVAAHAVARCARKDSLPLLKETLQKVERGEIKDEKNHLKTFLEITILGLE